MSDQEPGPTHTPYGQSDPYGQGTNPYGQPPAGQPNPYGQQPSYGMSPQPTGDRRPGTVTAAAWITMVFAAIIAALFGLTAMALLVARDQVISAMEEVPEFRDANIDAEAAVGVLVAVTVALVVWSLISILLAILVLRRSNVARILLVISSAVTAVFSLLAITTGVPAVLLIASIATIVLLFTGGAGDWFKRVGSPPGGYPGGPSGYQGDQYANPYGSQYGAQPGPEAPPQYPPDNPYGQPPSSEGGTDYPPRDYPNR